MKVCVCISIVSVFVCMYVFNVFVWVSECVCIYVISRVSGFCERGFLNMELERDHFLGLTLEKIRNSQISIFQKKAVKFEYFALLFCSAVLFDVVYRNCYVWMEIGLQFEIITIVPILPKSGIDMLRDEMQDYSAFSGVFYCPALFCALSCKIAYSN